MDTVQELRRKRELVARIICHDFADQETTPDDFGRGDYRIELDGVERGFKLFPGFRPDLRTPDYDTRQHRQKRRRYIRLQNLCMTYVNASIAIECYEKLQGECDSRAAVLDMLVDACITFGEQYSRFAQWDMQAAHDAEKQGGRRKGKGDLTPEQWRQVDARVDELEPTYRRSEAAKMVRTEIMQGRFGAVQNIPGVDRIRQHKAKTRKKSLG